MAERKTIMKKLIAVALLLVWTGAAPAAIQNPTDIPNLYLWLNADSLGLPHGATVTAWTDSVNGNVFSGTATYNTGYANGHAAVKFDGISNTLFKTPLAGSVPSTGSLTLFIVGNFTSPGKGGYMCSGNFISGSRLRIIDDSTKYMIRVGAGDAFTSAAGSLDASAHVHTIVSGQSGNSVNFLIDIITQASGNSGTGALPMSGFALASYLGTGGYADCSIAEVLIYRGALTTAQITDVYNYLRNKYGIIRADKTPLAEAGSNYVTWLANLPQTLNGTVNDYGEGDINEADVVWTITDAPEEATASVTKISSNPLAPTAVFTTDRTGEYTLSLTAADWTQQTSSDSVVIRVETDACTAAYSIGRTSFFDYNKDCVVGILDYADLARNWMVSIALTEPLPIPDPEPEGLFIKDKASFVNYLTQPLPDGARKERYITAVNNQSVNYCGATTTFTQSRSGTENLGRLAFCYHTPGLRYYKDPTALSKIAGALEFSAQHIDSNGKFTFDDSAVLYDAGMHEHCWRLEPLICSFVWAYNDIDPLKRPMIEAALIRASQYAADRPVLQTNNRGSVWCAITYMAGVYFQRQDWINQVEKYADYIIKGVVYEDGEVGEHTEQYAGGGPDGNYTYTSWAYVYIYYLVSGKEKYPDLMLQASRWLSLVNTISGWPVVDGAMVRTSKPDLPALRDALPSNECFSKQDPFFATIATKALLKNEQYLYGGNHIISPTIWSLLEAGVAAQEPLAIPSWHSNHTREYSRPSVHYGLIGRNYSTGVVFRARKGPYRDIPAEGLSLRGMQTWAWKDENPIVHHSSQSDASWVKCGTIQTNLTDVPQVAGKYEVLMQTGPLVNGANLATFACRQESLWNLFVYTPVSTVAVYGGPAGTMSARWKTNPNASSSPVHNAGARRFDYSNRIGTLYYLSGSGSVSSNAVNITLGAGPLVCAFSDKQFVFGSLTNDILTFQDASGSYHLDLSNMLSGGNINRAAMFRLTKQ